MKFYFCFCLSLLLPGLLIPQPFESTASTFPTGAGESTSNRFSLCSTVGETVVGPGESASFDSTAGFGSYDRFNPVAVCMNFTVVLENGQATITAMNIDGGSSDNVGIVNFELSQTEFDSNDVGVQNIELTVTDYFGLTDTCTAMVEVVDGMIDTYDQWLIR